MAQQTKKELDHLEVHPGENGGHMVRHVFKRQVVNRKGAMSGGMYSERPDDEEHDFGPGGPQEHAMMAHIAKALDFSGAAKDGEDQQTARPQRKGKAAPAEDQQDTAVPDRY